MTYFLLEPRLACLLSPQSSAAFVGCHAVDVKPTIMWDPVTCRWLPASEYVDPIEPAFRKYCNAHYEHGERPLGEFRSRVRALLLRAHGLDDDPAGEHEAWVAQDPVISMAIALALRSRRRFR